MPGDRVCPPFDTVKTGRLMPKRLSVTTCPMPHTDGYGLTPFFARNSRIVT
jgi:hypothetical protein